MWNLNEENESNANYWDADEYVNNRNTDLGVGKADPIRSYGDLGHPFNIFKKRIVQVEVFQGSERYDKFNEFAKENNIGEEDIISIDDISTAVENRLALFYLK